MRETLKTDEARQGKKGMPVLRVLAASIVLAVIVWVGIGAFGGNETPVPATTEETTSQ